MSSVLNEMGFVEQMKKLRPASEEIAQFVESIDMYPMALGAALVNTCAAYCKAHGISLDSVLTGLAKLYTSEGALPWTHLVNGDGFPEEEQAEQEQEEEDTKKDRPN